MARSLSVSTPESAHPSIGQWMLWSAIAGSFASVLHFVATFWGPLFWPRLDYSQFATPIHFTTTLLARQLGMAVSAGIAFGITLGLALTIAWKPLVSTYTQLLPWRGRTIGRAAVLGSIVSWGGYSLVSWYVGPSILLTTLCGILGGAILGRGQAALLWMRVRQRRTWLVWHSLTFAGTFVLLVTAARSIASLWAYPCAWLSIWSGYGLWMGIAFSYLHRQQQAEP